MADLNERDSKLVQYLNEAYGKEKQLETALQAHISLTSRAPYKKRLQQHLKETKSHAREVERRIKQLGGKADGLNLPGGDRLAEVATSAQAVGRKAAALAQGPLHAARGTSSPETQLKNAKTEYSEEAEEIATYTAIEALAETVGDKDTAKLARTIRREEERMAGYLEKLIPQLTKAVATAEIPASQRSSGRRGGGSRRRSSSSARARSGTRSTSGRSSSSRSTSARSTSARSGSSSRSSRSGSRSRSTSGRSSTSRNGSTARSRSSSRSGNRS
jgi:ferritin-like metal-binding protein YciE